MRGETPWVFALILSLSMVAVLGGGKTLFAEDVPNCVRTGKCRGAYGEKITTGPPPSPSKTGVLSEGTFTIPIIGGSIRVRDFRKKAKKLPQKYVLEEGDCELSYFPSDKRFSVVMSLDKDSLPVVQKRCEQFVLRTLNVSEREVCILMVSFASDQSLPHETSRPDFCTPSQPSQISGDRAGAMLTMNTSKGALRIKNFFKFAKHIGSKYYVISEGGVCDIGYYEPDSSFTVTLSIGKQDQPHVVQKSCERFLLQTLELTESDACKLHLSLSAPRASNPYHEELWGRNLSLTFCGTSPSSPPTETAQSRPARASESGSSTQAQAPASSDQAFQRGLGVLLAIIAFCFLVALLNNSTLDGKC